MLKSIFIVLLLILSGYLYIRVVDLQKQNTALRQDYNQLISLRARNLKIKQAPFVAIVDPQTKITPDNFWVDRARKHILLAEDAVAKGNFADAVKETKFAELALTRATNSASSQSKQTIADLRSKLNDVETKAKSIWRAFGG